MSAYSTPPKTHLLNPLMHLQMWTTCGLYIRDTAIAATSDYKEVTCKSCKRTNVYRMKRLGVQRDDWHE